LIFIFDPVIPTGMTAKNKSRHKPTSQKISKRLAAAAPHLLGACYSILNTLEEMDLGDIGALDDVRDAIHRANGNPTSARAAVPAASASAANIAIIVNGLFIRFIFSSINAHLRLLTVSAFFDFPIYDRGDIELLNMNCRELSSDAQFMRLARRDWHRGAGF
jgi:hypothetical protein